MVAINLALIGFLLRLTGICSATSNSDNGETYLFPRDNPAYDAPASGMRSNIWTNPVAAYVVAYPSIGGVVLAQPDHVQLKHLELPRSYDTPLSGNEDDLALRLVQIGAQWWPDWDTYAKHKKAINAGVEYRHHYPPRLEIGYHPTAGVMVAKYSHDISQTRGLDHGPVMDTLPPVPENWIGQMRWASSMQERAIMMEEFGATVYETADACSDLPKSVAQAKEMFEQYRELLSKMEDWEYQKKWTRELRGLPDNES